jgi:hypothetical protein
MTPHRTDDGPLLSGILMAILAGVVFIGIVVALVLIPSLSTGVPATTLPG